MLSTGPRFRLAVLLVLCLAVTSGIRPEAAFSQPKAPPILSLGSALKNAVWDTASRGPLLVVGPETIKPYRDPSRPLPLFYPFFGEEVLVAPDPLPDGRYRVTDLTQYFGCRAVRLRGVTVLAPKDRVTINADPGKPNLYAGLRREESLQILLATLTEEQWKQIGGPKGLGYENLDTKQRDLYLAYLSDEVRINTISRAEADKDAVAAMRNAAKNQMVLSGDQRKQIRIKLRRQATISFVGSGVNSDYSGIASSNSTDTVYRSLAPAAGENSYTHVFGQQVRQVQPNRLKSQQIDFEAPALRSLIPLTGMKTVDDLVARVRKITRLEIYVDGRAGKLPLFVRASEAQSASAGELLKALCWGLTGAIRKVSDGQETVFVLSQDIDGVGARMTRLGDWYSIASAEKERVIQEAARKVRAKSAIRYLIFDEGDTFALSPDLVTQVESKWGNFASRQSGITVQRSELTPDQQNLVLRSIAEYNAMGMKNNRGETVQITDSDRVRVRMNVGVRLVVPGADEVKIYGEDLLSFLLPPPTTIKEEAGVSPPAAGPSADSLEIPAGMSIGGILLAAPRNTDEARLLVRTARKRGLRQIWIELPLRIASKEVDTEGLMSAKDMVAAAVSEAGLGKDAIAVVPAVRLLSLPASSVKAAPETDDKAIGKTISGETEQKRAQRLMATVLAVRKDPLLQNSDLIRLREWVLPETPGLAARLAKHLGSILELPGIGGVTLLDTAPPGYSGFDPPSYRESTDFPGAVGYTGAARISFIRTAGYDPVDLMETDPWLSIDWRIPPFTGNALAASTGESAKALWDSVRSRAAEKLLTDLHPALRKKGAVDAAILPVYLAGLDAPVSGGNTRFVRWDSADMLPRQEKVLSRGTFRLALLSCDLRDTGTALESALASARIYRTVREALERHSGNWDGIVLDLRNAPSEEK